jgi:molecular chaperone DnaK
MTVMIPRNTTIPSGKKETFTTFSDNQTAVDVKVHQGERKMAEDNRLLGVFRLDEILPAPKSVPKIEVTFDIDANGILNVSAKDLGTGKQQQITIKANSGFSKDEIEQMKQEAEQYAEEDDRRVALVEAKNSGDQLVDSVEKQMKEHPEQLAGREEEVSVLVEQLKDVMDSNSVEEITAAIDGLVTVQHEIAQELYNKVQQEEQDQVQEQVQAPEDSQEQPPEDDVIDV